MLGGGGEGKVENVQDNSKSDEKETRWLRYYKNIHTSFYLGHQFKTV